MPGRGRWDGIEASWGTFPTWQCPEKPKSASQAVRDLIADGVTEPADIIAEAKKRWKMTVSKPTVYNIKSSGKGKKKAKAKATAKKGSTQDAVKALKGVVDQQGIEKTRELLEIMEALG